MHQWSLVLGLGKGLFLNSSEAPKNSSSRKTAAKAAKHKKYLKKGKKK
jgi:hypothetical protein